jgi:hypothetical protein
VARVAEEFDGPDPGEDPESRLWRVIPRLAGTLLMVPVVLGFVALGTLVVVGRSLRGVAREAWPWRGGGPPGDMPGDGGADD